MEFFKEDDSITSADVFRLLGLMKWRFASPEEKEICDRNLVDLAREHGMEWIRIQNEAE